MAGQEAENKGSAWRIDEAAVMIDSIQFACLMVDADRMWQLGRKNTVILLPAENIPHSLVTPGIDTLAVCKQAEKAAHIGSAGQVFPASGSCFKIHHFAADFRMYHSACRFQPEWYPVPGVL